MMQVLRNADLPVSRWTNGAGRKADLVTGDGWMTGFAWLDADAPFSLFAGSDRTITLVEGPGFTLELEGRALPVTARFVPTGFDGGAVTFCRVSGASRVLNAMTDRRRFRHAVTLMDRSGRVDPVGSVACLVVAVEGQASIGSVTLERLDAARLEEPGAVVLPPGSLVAVVTISQAA